MTLETCDLWDIWSDFLMTIFMTIFDNFDDNFSWQFLMTIFDANFLLQFLMTIFEDNFWWQFSANFQIFKKFSDFWKFLWHLRHWLHFWQLRTWIQANLCYLTINCDTGQHSQFLRCFLIYVYNNVFIGFHKSNKDFSIFVSLFVHPKSLAEAVVDNLGM